MPESGDSVLGQVLLGDRFMPRRIQPGLMAVLWFSVAAGPLFSAPPATQSRPAPREEPEPIDLTLLFIRDPLVQTDLKLDADQGKRIGELLEEYDGPLFQARNLPPRECKAKATAIMTSIEKELGDILRPEQRTRFDQIMLRTRGLSGFVQPKSIEALKLSQRQRRQIVMILQAAERASGTSRDARGQRIVRNADGEQPRVGLTEILAVLTEEQRRTWKELLGAKFEVTRLKPLAFKAPEFRDVDGWINAKPMTLASLRGQVVVVHFWTFACVNCVNNYPAYRALQDAYAMKGVTFIGIHTPETEGERNIEAVRKKAAENKLTFPIAVDNGKYNWDAWGNQVWPAIYLVDKRGFVRFWWYGELGGKGSSGERILKARLDALLAEKEAQATSQPAR